MKQPRILVYFGAGQAYRTAEIVPGLSSFQALRRWAESLEAQELWYVAEAPLDWPGAQQVPAAPGDGRALLAWLSAQEPSTSWIYAWGDQPLLRPDLTRLLWERHAQARAHYTFCDGAPLGLAPEILHPALWNTLAASWEKKPLDEGWPRDAWFQLLSRDINAYDIEVVLTPEDLRGWRLEFFTDRALNLALCRRFWADHQRLGWQDFLKTLQDRKAEYRTLPSYLWFQTSARPGSEATYKWIPGSQKAPGPDRPLDLSPELWAQRVARLGPWVPEAVVNLGLYGDLGRHPDWPALVATLLTVPGWHLLVETDGQAWSEPSIDRLNTLAGPRVRWIFELDTLDPAVWAKLHPGADFAKAWALARYAAAQAPGRVWWQALRMPETDPGLGLFYKQAQQEQAQPLIQKYDTYAGRLPVLPGPQLAPLKRLPCWHVKRDLVVTLDGRVLPCREDGEGTLSWGHLDSEDPQALWERGQALHAAQAKEDWPALCRNCDEYYTYNF